MKNIVLGINSIYEVLKKRPQDIFQIVISKERSSQGLKEIIAMAFQRRVSISYRESKEWLRWIHQLYPGFSDHMSHQGIGAEVKIQKEISLNEIIQVIKEKNELGFILVLDEIEDPQNLGALIRSAACAKVHAIVIPKRGAASVTPAVVKVSAGGTEHVSVCSVSNINYALDRLKKEGFWTVGLALEGEISLFELSCHNHLALVIGNEERGLRRLVRESCDQLVKIPMPGQMESLNASAAGGIALFEVVRQRLNNGGKL